jgi:hypothetical protein
MVIVVLQETKEPEPKEVTKEVTKKTKVKIEPITWEEFKEFETSSARKKKSWVKEAVWNATKRPIKLENLTRGQILSIIVQVHRYNLQSKLANRPLLRVKYDFKKGIVMIAPETTPETPEQQ